MGLFALLTLFLAGVGVYAVIAHSVTQRTNEIGIRLALGARVANVLGQVMWQGMRTTIVGIVPGLIAAYWLSEYMTSMLFGVSPTDSVTFAGIPVILSVVAFVACLVPALRATRVDPVVALRQESCSPN